MRRKRAGHLGCHAPSLFNAQPWSWEISDEGADLFMDVARSFPITDPDKREMRIGCGAALDHLQIALAAHGWRCSVERETGSEGGLLARVRLTDRCDVDPDDLRLVEAIPRRHTDRRPFASETVSEPALAALQVAADAEGVHVQVITRDEHRIWLSVDFELVEPGSLAIPESADEHPVWCILWTDRDGPLEWLGAGEALSRLLLHATDLGLAAGVQSQPVEIPMIRAQLNEHLLSGMGHAQVLVRVGYPAGYKQ